MLVLTNRRRSLENYLSRWRNAPRGFDSDQPTDSSWHIDSYEISPALVRSKPFFPRAVDWLFSYRIYPESILSSISDFGLENRWLRVGDRIIQEIRVVPGFIHAVTMNIVSGVIHEPLRRGFTVQTSVEHFEQGEMSILMADRGDKTTLLIQAISKPNQRVPRFAHSFARRLQLKAHHELVKNFYALAEKQTGGDE